MPFYYYPISTIPVVLRRRISESTTTPNAEFQNRYEGNIDLFSVNSYEINCQTCAVSYNTLNSFFYHNNTCYIQLDNVRNPTINGFDGLRQPYYMSYSRLRGDVERIAMTDCVTATIVGNEKTGNMPVPSNFYMATSGGSPMLTPYLVFLQSRMLTTEQPLPYITACSVTNPSWMFEGLQHYSGFGELPAGVTYRKYMILEAARTTIARCAVPITAYGETGYGKAARFWKAVVPVRTVVSNTYTCENTEEGILTLTSGLVKSLPKCRITSKTYSDRYVLACKLLYTINSKLKLTGDKLMSWRDLPLDLSKLSEVELAQLQNVKHTELLKTFPQGRALLRL